MATYGAHMSNQSLQIQAVLYNNDFDALSRSLTSIKNALQQSSAKNLIDRCAVVYGDASPAPLLSEDAVARIAQENEGVFSFRYIYFNENTGFGKGQNKLAEKATTDYLLVINPDLLFNPPFFSRILEPFLLESGNAGIAEARQTPIEHPKDYDTKTGETDWSSGACMLVPTDTFQTLNGFDYETFFMYCEDVDFSWRVRALGKKIIYCPDAVAFHPKRLNTQGHLNPTETERYYSSETALLMAHKWTYRKQLKHLIRHFETSHDPYQKKALEVFRKRERVGTLPSPIDPQHAASTFHRGEYTTHRFGL